MPSPRKADHPNNEGGDSSAGIRDYDPASGQLHLAEGKCLPIASHPSLVLCRGTACIQELQKIGTILQIGDFSVLLKEGCGKSHLSLPSVSPFLPGKLSLRELKFWHLMHAVFS